VIFNFFLFRRLFYSKQIYIYTTFKSVEPLWIKVDKQIISSNQNGQLSGIGSTFSEFFGCYTVVFFCCTALKSFCTLALSIQNGQQLFLHSFLFYVICTLHIMYIDTYMYKFSIYLCEKYRKENK
jgi:hypothetical protein